MIRTNFLKLLSFIILFALASGCIYPDATDKIPVAGLNSEDLIKDLQNSTPNRTDNPLPDETGLGEQNKTEENKSTAYLTDSRSPKIPEVPTYHEEKTNVVYPREYRLLSINFQRGIGSGNEKIESEVFNITGKTSGYNIKDACDVFDYVNQHWEYRYEKNGEFFFDASQTINEGYKGDCDDYSIVMSALLKNMGFNTRVVTATNESYGHAYPELYIGDNNENTSEILRYLQSRYYYAENIWYSGRELKDGKIQYWLNFDWSGSNGYRHPGGIYVKGAEIIYYPNGLIEL
ncbi:transglutaminase-like domain-containing protein [Methanosarcina barkeri]|uniref:Transglutaminase domain-containing protein n=1 Tax=Methanosarcina barkeri CM1 TaxID=796385 RepID=A0A0G3CAQ1_METBA|nr:transglutaminase-like domain-containing protein [Methanosarcina barkeri]AKJ39101.1 transglutaminase domain-containing protein [Methanosarcina barkeri CM1]